MIGLILRNRTVWAGAAIFISFTVIYALTPPNFAHTFAEVVNAVLIAVSSAVAVVYTPIVVRTLASAQRNATYYQVLGIWLAWVSLAIRGVIGLTWRFQGMPGDFPNGFWWLFDLFIAIVAATLHITAPGTVG